MYGASEYGVKVPGFVAKEIYLAHSFILKKWGNWDANVKKFQRGGRSMEIFPAIDLKKDDASGFIKESLVKKR